ncbi:3-ketosteroid-delta-1-dehydrogenase [Novosphingobium sp. AAP83]|uniref:FAD-dependent oxidoreductase n=1 Tax=Novosphingobium sp. AAP83 TaxID=1523425 RepID=UPI0006B96CF6|nr:FAD-dependent oxidoreductase [Novosphingobium sp. AAP83]KPF91784.1 3-ketosteroid-delta-1-dehydrogenase [Novosphingobium sp. AAP83]
MSDFDETFDWIVVGSGAGSMTSALVMRQAGKRVLVLEKTPYVGGTTAKSGGVIWVPNNRLMQKAGEIDSTEAGVKYLEHLAQNLPGSTPAKRRAYVTQSQKMIDFLIAQGIPMERGADFWPDYYDEAPGGCKTSRTVVARYFNKAELGPEWAAKLRPGFVSQPAMLSEGMKLAWVGKSWKIKLLLLRIGLRLIAGKLTGKQWVSAGAALQGRLLKAILDAGADVRTDSAVRELVYEDGRVTGVVAMIEGQPRRIGAALGVLVNAGGFAQNQAMRDHYMPGTQAAWSNTPEGDTGDMHTEMERVGAELGQMDQMVGYQMTRMPGWEQAFVKPPAQSLTGKPGAILVDQSGVRYMNEGGSYELYCQNMFERNRTVPAIPSWAIFDAHFAEQYPIAGVKMAKYYQVWKDSGYLKEAETPAALAELIGVPPTALETTVARWNDFVDAGVDADFGRGAREYDKWLGDPFLKPNPALARIDKGPFYAVDVVPGDVSTYGGAVTDERAQVLRPDGSVINGLYACGVSSASVMGGVYVGAGASIGPSMAFGFVAAKHAAGLENTLA